MEGKKTPIPLFRVKIFNHGNNCQNIGSFCKKFMFLGLSAPAGVLISKSSVPNLGSSSLPKDGGARSWEWRREAGGGEIHLAFEKLSADLHLPG